MAAVELVLDGGLAFVRIVNPPVNSLSAAVRRGLLDAFERIAGDDAVEAVVLHGAGRGFSAGGDIAEFGTQAAAEPPGLSLHVHPAIEHCPRPVVAMVHGFAVGGGLETALACHYRVAEASTKVGLPEGRLGVIPLSGTQRLPRVIGLERALDMIMDGESRLAGAFADTALFDRIAPEGQGLAVAAALAREAAGRPGPHRLIRDLPPPDAGDVLERRRSALLASHPPAAILGLFEAVAASAEAPDFNAGMARARRIYDRLAGSDAVRSARDAFLAGQRPSPT